MKRCKQILSVVLLCSILIAMFPTSAIAINQTRAEDGQEVLDLILRYYNNGKWQDVSVLNNNNLPQITYTGEKGFTFIIEFAHPECIKRAYITSKGNGETKYLEAFYNDELDTFVASGFFDDDSSYIPGNVEVEYVQKTDEVYVTDSIDWTELAFDKISVEQVDVTVNTDTSTTASIDLTQLLNAEKQVLLDTAIDVFDASTGTNLDEFLGTFKELDNMASYLIEGKDNKKYVLYLDYSDPKTYAMLVKDVSGNKFIKLALNSSETLSGIAETLSNVNTVSKVIYNNFSIQSEMNQLRTEIQQSPLSSVQKTEAIRKTYDLEKDKSMFSLITTVLPLIVTAAAVSSPPAILFSALLSAITTSADYFWDCRVGMIQSELIVLDFAVTGSCRNNLTWTIDTHGTLRISGSGPMGDYFSYQSIPWAKYHQQVRSIVLEPGITKIGNYAFSGAAVSSSSPAYPNLTGTLVLPDSVTSIGDHAFSGRSEFTGNLYIPDGVTTIGSYAFYGCTGFTGDLYIPNSVTEVGSWAFSGCSGFDGNLTLSNSLTRIEYTAFSCKNLQGELVIPDSVAYIGVGAFYEFGFDRFGFRSLKLGKNVEIIDDSAFANCIFESPIYIPASVKTIGKQALHFDSSTNIYFEGDAPSIYTRESDGVSGVSPSFLGNKDITLYYIPGRTGWIDSDAYNAEKGTWNGYKLLPWGEEPCEHEYSIVITAPNCTEQGYTTHTCSRCGDSYVDTYVAALGHSFGEWAIKTPATSTTAGQRERICSRCQSKETETIPATGTGNTPVTPPSSTNTSSGSSGSNYTPSAPSLPVNTSTTTQEGVSTTETTAVPIANTQGGKATSTVSMTVGDEIVKQAVSNKSENVVIAPNITSSVTKTEVFIPVSTIDQIGDLTNASLTVSTPVADVTISNGKLGDLTTAGNTVAIIAEKVGNTVGLSVTVDGKPVDRIPDGVTLTVPMGNTTPGTVAMLIYEDGTKEVVRKSITNGDSVIIPLDGSAKLEIADNSQYFADVPTTNWAADAVAFASARELFNGTGANQFSPNLPMSRGMLAVVLHNLENNPSQVLTGMFTDVNNSVWYASAVSWAVEKGIVSGYGDGRFGPNDNISREQLAVMLWRYAGSPTPMNKELDFTDADKASGYALDALYWAVENGIITGYGNGQLVPQGSATRAQVAQMLKNYLER